MKKIENENKNFEYPKFYRVKCIVFLIKLMRLIILLCNSYLPATNFVL